MIDETGASSKLYIQYLPVLVKSSKERLLAFKGFEDGDGMVMVYLLRNECEEIRDA